MFQAVWNQQSHLPSAWGVKDYDVFYYDNDLSWEAENEVIASVQRLFQHLDVNIENKNQDRVHQWYSKGFGGDYPQL
ncbi:nucleotidyltransferase family protein, partial [Pseudomonas syringae pv. tagetis]|uniref:nucleotidyltransferase family protein n=1 Tax=Pseudomonas syringae group genomosp. 7 TaxID=251699 RepID=UPI0037700DD3